MRFVQLVKRNREGVTVNLYGQSAVTTQTDVPKNISHLISRAGMKLFVVLCVGAYLMAIGVETLLLWWTCLLPSKRKGKTGSSQTKRSGNRS